MPHHAAMIAMPPRPSKKLKIKNKKVKILEGELPLATNPPVGCVFNTRCPIASDICKPSRPLLEFMPDGGLVACFKA